MDIGAGPGASVAVGVAVPLRALGPQINASPATFKTAQLNYLRIQWEVADPNQWDANNGVVVLQGVGYVDDTFGGAAGSFSRTQLSALP